ncbi:MAG: FAD:protein FMN transferase [Bryobacteraceae bacterium]|nr:FAD:protein FMN transferase [Bryobacteraceae bacterium]
MTLETFAAKRTEGLQQLEELVRTLEGVQTLVSTWEPGSELSRLNRQPIGVPLELDRSICDLLAELRHWSHLTDGTFDPAVGRLIDAWGLQTKPRLAADADIRNALQRSGMSLLTVYPGSDGCRAARTGDIRIDTGAFGKGVGLRRALRNSRLSGYPWMINGGGQVAVHGSPPAKEAWEVSIAHPADRSQPVLTLNMKSGSLATSGGSESDVTVHTVGGNGARIGHIVDPRTGRPVLSETSVSVWHSDPLTADILSTALYIMGVERALRFANRHSLAVCLLTPDGDRVIVQASDAFTAAFLPDTSRPANPVLSPSPDL